MAGPRMNAAVAALMLSAFIARALHVGVIDAAAEAVGLANFEWYIRWRESYSPLHPELFYTPLDAWLDPRLLHALHNTTHPQAALRALARQDGPGVNSFPLLSPRFCQLLSEELVHFAASGRTVKPPNDMHAYGVALVDVGLSALADSLVATVFTPLAAALYVHPAPEAALGSLLPPAVLAAGAVKAESCCSSHHAFAVAYEADAQPGLDMHHDASDVTLNVNLNSTSVEGGALSFCGFVGWPCHRQFSFTYTHEVGRAVMHLGSHRHGVADVSQGFRHNLIVWGREGLPRGGGYSPSSGSRRHPAEEAPDERCLSWTHDADYESFLPLPEAGRRRREERAQHDELMALVRDATDDQIARLPESYQPLVRMLKMADQTAHGEAGADTARSYSETDGG